MQQAGGGSFITISSTAALRPRPKLTWCGLWMKRGKHDKTTLADYTFLLLLLLVNRQCNKRSRIHCKQVHGIGTCLGQYSFQLCLSRCRKYTSVRECIKGRQSEELEEKSNGHWTNPFFYPRSLSKFAGATNSSDKLTEEQLRMWVPIHIPKVTKFIFLISSIAIFVTDLTRLFPWVAYRSLPMWPMQYCSLLILLLLSSLGLIWQLMEEDVYEIPMSKIPKDWAMSLGQGWFTFATFTLPCH